MTNFSRNILIFLGIYVFAFVVGADAYSFEDKSQQRHIPRTVAGLQKQLGAEFFVYKQNNYIIATDLDKNKADYVVNGVFVNCKKILVNQFFDARADDIVVIYIFKDKSSYFNGMQKYLKMQPISPYGHYGNRDRYIVVNYATGPGTLVHELTHSLMAIDFPGAPIWISEGLASLYEQCRVENGQLVGEQNWRLPELLSGIRSNRLTPLKLLFKSDTKVFRMLRESLHYAESRYFCKYLQEKGLLVRVYKAFRNNPHSSNNGIKVVEAALGKNIDLIEKDWIKWAKQQEWNGKSF